MVKAIRGAVYVFGREDGRWREQQKLLASDGARSDEFGYAVALSGETVLISARHADVNSVEAQGAVYVFAREGESWNEQQKLTASDGAESNEFGYSVALEGETALVGAYLASVDDTERQGKAYFFQREQRDQAQTIDFPPPPNADQGYAIGATVSLAATASSGLPVDFRSETPVVCSVDGQAVTTLAAGECRLVATQPGNEEYAAASTVVTFNVVSASIPPVYLPLIRR